MPALYRQYRPITFAEITGQQHITAVLGQEIVKDSIAHAYLFQGPRGTGKTTTARVFAKRLNCSESKTIESCEKCTSCIAFQEKRDLDILEIDAASNRGIDDIRALRETASLAPTIGKYKVYVIDEVHMLSGPAFAALLKILEEPPKHVIFILATTELHKVPATIASRCQVFRFKRATEEDMHTRLSHLLAQEKRTADDDLIAFITARSDGCYRDAESLLGQLLSQFEGTVTTKEASDLLGVPSPETIEGFLQALLTFDAKQAIIIATKAYKDGFDPDQFLQEAIHSTRRKAVLAVLSGQGTQRFVAIMRSFLVATQDLAIVPDPMIAIELAIITACATPGQSQSAPTGRTQAPAQGAAIASTPYRTPTASSQGSSIVRDAAPQPRTITPPSFAQPTSSAPSQPAPVAIPQPKEKREAPRPLTPTPASSSNNPEKLAKIQSSWGAIIQHVRKDNPVASTFLRATEPVDIQGGSLVLNMQFPLHKTFFDRPDNKDIVANAITAITGEAISIMCQLQVSTKDRAQVMEERQAKEEDLLKNIQEVFGNKPA